MLHVLIVHHVLVLIFTNLHSGIKHVFIVVEKVICVLMMPEHHVLIVIAGESGVISSVTGK